MAVTYSLRPLALLLLAGVLPVSAQRADQFQYVGSNTCEECHRQGYRRFASSKMARVFFEAPRNELEARGCEACHGPGRDHVEAARAHDAARAAQTTYLRPAQRPVHSPVRQELAAVDARAERPLHAMP
jgi:hypothetical protein